MTRGPEQDCRTCCLVGIAAAVAAAVGPETTATSLSLGEEAGETHRDLQWAWQIQGWGYNPATGFCPAVGQETEPSVKVEKDGRL